MHAFGGVYLDIDFQCFKSTEFLLAGHEVVLQLEEAGNVYSANRNTHVNRLPGTYCQSFAVTKQPAKVLAKCLPDHLPNCAGMI